jgi:hypothetical protein
MVGFPITIILACACCSGTRLFSGFQLCCIQVAYGFCLWDSPNSETSGDSPGKNEIHERPAIRGPILDLLRLEFRVSSSHPHVPRHSCSCGSELCSCLLEAASISERSLETFALVCFDAVAVFSYGHFSRSLVPRIRSQLLSRRINRKPGLWTLELAFISDGWIVGVSNEGVPMVRIQFSSGAPSCRDGSLLRCRNGSQRRLVIVGDSRRS